MKTKKIIVITAVWGHILLLSKWFSSELYQTFTPFLLIIPLAILFLVSIGLGVWTVIVLIKRIKAERLLAALPLIIFIFVVSIHQFVSFSLPKVRIEHALHAKNREVVVEAIQNNEYTDDGIGNIRLPFSRRFLSCDGEVYVYQNDEQGIVIGFWSFRGLLMNPFESVIYTSYPKPPTTSTLGCGELYTVKKLSEHWYWVVGY